MESISMEIDVFLVLNDLYSKKDYAGHPIEENSKL